MSDIVNDIKAKKQKLSLLKSENDKLIGQREQVLQYLKNDFGVENEADAKELLVNCETELSDCKADLDKINAEMDEIINKISKK